MPAQAGRDIFISYAARRDFFISYAASDRAWAEWIAWQLEEAGYTTILQAWDFRPGEDFAHSIQQAVASADRTIAVLSDAYVTSPFGEAEWRAAFARDPAGESGELLLVRVDDVTPAGLLTTRIYIDLAGKSVDKARGALLAGVQRDRLKPAHAPRFPGPQATASDSSSPSLGPFRFDVFLCHNSADKNIAKQLAAELKRQGIRPWLDQWEIAPGTDWQGALEEQVRSIRSAAVLVGSSGFGPWQDLEKKAFLQQFLGRGSPVIPVILSDYKGELELPPFLSMLQYVDFRESDPDPMERLIWGITGKRPTVSE